MHQCLKCGRMVQTVTEIEQGCPCGSKVFVFTRHGSAAAPPSASFSSPAPKPKLTLMPFLSKSASSTPSKPAVAPAAPATTSSESVQSPVAKPSAQAQPTPNANAPPSASPLPVPTPAAIPPAPVTDSIITPAPASAAPSRVPNSPAVASVPISEESEEDLDRPYSEVWLAKGGKVQSLSPSEVENVRQLQKGVYEVNVRALTDGPIVLRDSEGVYYVRLPFTPLPGPSGDTHPPDAQP